MTDTDDLVARLERLSGPDREVDFWCWWYGASTESRKANPSPPDADYARRNIEHGNTPRYTASTDAALTLFRRPFGDCIELVITIYDGHCNARLQRRGMYAGEETVLAEGDASEPACAIAACALRSRTTEGK